MGNHLDHYGRQKRSQTNIDVPLEFVVVSLPSDVLNIVLRLVCGHTCIHFLVIQVVFVYVDKENYHSKGKNALSSLLVLDDHIY